ncbi:hypothetical protein LRS10_01005 [Phenylobacterium sp. J426]|uniref:hypothetical protein n=1 Tax=Phenylobacterium sp. J426 TaxID=2898439 RepID=UPI002150A7F1|nr:hypothetical protein [Phenylobacterium sp. J426]MCR5872897.1 hypothetical protein [Phenylobacterium sp. J426]
MRAPPPRSAVRRLSPADRLRGQIEAAEAEGALRADMVLRLTRSDVDHLKRDTSLAVTDISFAAGVMRFLGVKIEQGGVAESVLEQA